MSARPIPTPDEEWRPIAGYEGVYEVSDRGRVRRLPMYGVTWNPRILDMRPSSDGSLEVKLTYGGASTTRKRRMARLVAEAFIGTPLTNGRRYQVEHLNHDPADNRPANLRFVTHGGQPLPFRPAARPDTTGPAEMPAFLRPARPLVTPTAMPDGATDRPEPPVSEHDIERFWTYVSRGDDCWEWVGSNKSDWGYGRLPYGPWQDISWIAAHRLSFWLHNGYLPELVRHTCDNPPCVRPDHLLPGDNALNLRDSIERGRANQDGLRAATAARQEAKRVSVESWLAAGRKPCSRCKTIKPFSSFHRNRAQIDGLCESCIDCRKATRKPSTRKVAA